MARHQLAAPGANETWDPAHRWAAEALALGRHLHVVPDPVGVVTSEETERLDLGDGDYDKYATPSVTSTPPITIVTHDA